MLERGKNFKGIEKMDCDICKVEDNECHRLNTYQMEGKQFF